MIRAVIIDFDDTLCLTEEACFHLENEVLGLMGLPPQQRSVHRATWGRPLFEAIKERSPGIDVDVFKDVFRPLLTKTHLQWVKEKRIDAITAENIRALDELLAAGKQLFVLTSRSHSEVMHLLEPDHELAARVQAFYYHDIMPYHKPDARAFDSLLQEHQLKPEECLYVGDSPADAQAAEGARIHFIACLEAGIRTEADFGTFGVDAFVKRFADVPAAVAML